MKHYILLFSLCLSSSSIAQSLSDSLLVHYTFNGDATDQSGNGFDGSVNATLTSDRDGNANSAYHFNGVDEYIDLPNATELKPQLPVTLSFWVNFDQYDPLKSTIITTDFAQNNHSGVWVVLSGSGQISLSFGDATGNTSSSNRRTKIGNSAITPGTWHHVVCVVRGPMDMDIYLDCVNDGGIYTGSGGNLDYTSNPGSIGRKDAHASLPAYYFEGSLDDLRYWNRALSASEVEGLCGESSIGLEESTPEEPAEVPSLSIYPNPTENTFAIETDAELGEIQLFDATGKLVSTAQGVNTIDVSGLEPGSYFVKTLDSENRLIGVRTVIKN